MRFRLVNWYFSIILCYCYKQLYFSGILSTLKSRHWYGLRQSNLRERSRPVENNAQVLASNTSRKRCSILLLEYISIWPQCGKGKVPKSSRTASVFFFYMLSTIKGIRDRWTVSGMCSYSRGILPSLPYVEDYLYIIKHQISVLKIFTSLIFYNRHR